MSYWVLVLQNTRSLKSSLWLCHINLPLTLYKLHLTLITRIGSPTSGLLNSTLMKSHCKIVLLILILTFINSELSSLMPYLDNNNDSIFNTRCICGLPILIHLVLKKHSKVCKKIKLVLWTPIFLKMNRH